DQLLAADLLNPEDAFKAVEGSEICYLTVGLEYKTGTWQKQWPVLIKNVVDACVKHQSKLVFFDNIYSLDCFQLNHLTEETAIFPCSKKGKVRAEVNHTIMDAVEKGTLDAIIARAPDFFGKDRQNSLLMNLIYNNLEKGKKAQWFCNGTAKHSAGYVPDLAKATAILGNTTDAFNQVWNLPIDDEAPTAREWTSLFANAMNKKDGLTVLPSWSMLVLGIFIPILKEMHDIRYQYEKDYVFDSSKFKNRFQYKPTSNADAVKQTVEALKLTK
ncbi:MAG: NAD-dependent epimerase/dehydratase family protein, partial [Flavitalea sp.]